MQTYKAQVAYDTPIECNLRDANGKKDLSADSLTVQVRRYGKQYVQKTLSATGTAQGVASFTVPANLGLSSPVDPYDYTYDGSFAGLYRFDIVNGGQSIYRGLLEIT